LCSRKKIDPVKHFQIVFDYLVRLNRQAKKYLFDQIRNMDETPQFVDAPSNSTITSIGTQTVTLTDTGNSKSRFTVCLHISASGVMHDAVVIIKRKNIPKKWKIPKNILVFPNQFSATMSEFIMKKYINEHLIPSLNGKPGFFLNDEFAGHKTEEIIKHCMDNNINPMFIPAGTTSYLQPLDKCVNKPFKSNYEHFWCNWLAKEDDSSSSSDSDSDSDADSSSSSSSSDSCNDIDEEFNENRYTSRAGNRRRPSWPLILKWISKSMMMISSDTIKRSFECCGLKCDGDWQSFEHLNLVLKDLMKPVDDWDEEDKRINEFNKQVTNEYDRKMFEVENFINSCSQESYNFDLPPKPPKRTYTKRSTSSSAAPRKK
jgi:hypothetical protein